jgi:flagellar biosynthesis/type III secretory pathway chaperone
MIMESSEIVTLLRQEMAGYGSLLALFDEQQGHLWRREVEKVLETAAIIDQQVIESSQYREARESFLVAFARSHGQPGGATLRQLLPFFPVDERPMLEAFIDEINHLIHRVRRRARQNHAFMEKMLDLHRELVGGTTPGSAGTMYAPTGRVADETFAAPSLQQVG